jgi:colanic acid biosynthesis glycosyl transferase WcaI
MRIALITQWFEPEPGSAAHPSAVARALAERGHEVEVLTAFPSYPFGQVYDGYRMSVRTDEIVDGLRVRRIWDVPSHDRSAARRAASLLSFAVSATTQVGWLRKADVCLVYLTPATVGTAAIVLERLWGVPYVLYVQDLWPETVTASGFIRNPRVARAVEKALDRYLARLYRGAAGIAGISPTMAATLDRRGARVKPVSIPNWIDESVFKPAEPRLQQRLLPADRSWVMYAGGLGELQSLETAVGALAQLRDRPDIGLALVGEGVAKPMLERQVRTEGLEDRVRFLGSRPMAEMPSLMTEGIAQLVSLRDLPLFRGTIPSKLQASFACAQPVVCAVAGDAPEIVRRADAGVAVAPGDPQALANAFRTMADLSDDERRAMGLRGRALYQAELGSVSGATALESLLQDATRGRSR